MTEFVLRDGCIIIDFPDGPRAVKIAFLENETEIEHREAWLMKLAYEKVGVDKSKE